MRILLIEDDVELAAIIKDHLDRNFIVETAYTGEEAIRKLSDPFDLIILDVLLPDCDGVELCRITREAGHKMPILMLTGQDEVNMKVAALDSGADDYLTKPFEYSELLARIRALLRRPPAAMTSNTLTVGDLILDLTNQVAKRKDKIIYLRGRELQILEYLMRNKGLTITRRMIRDHVWESSYESEGNIVDVLINSLRKKIDKPFKRKLITTIRGSGYRIDEPLMKPEKKGGDTT